LCGRDCPRITGVWLANQDKATRSPVGTNLARRFYELGHAFVPEHPRREHDYRNPRRLGTRVKRRTIHSRSPDQSRPIPFDDPHAHEILQVFRVLKYRAASRVAQGESIKEAYKRSQ
jgi:hypothetical protein